MLKRFIFISCCLVYTINLLPLNHRQYEYKYNRKPNELLDSIVDKLIQYGYLAHTNKHNIDEIVRSIRFYKEFNHIELSYNDAGMDDYYISVDSLFNLLNNKWYTLKLFGKLFDKNAKRCSMPDFLRDKNNDLEVKHNLLNGRAFMYFENEDYELTELKMRSSKLVFTNIKSEFIEEFVKYQIISWWPTSTLTWTIVNRPVNLDYDDVRRVFEDAFNLWAKNSNLKFLFVMFNPNFKKPDIIIEFQLANSHDLFCEFKFAHSTLAHAFYPSKGVAHFEMGKNWSVKNDNQTNYMKVELKNVAIHEIGHLLGLGHSSNPQSIMYPDYKPDVNGSIFHKDDIEVLQYLYGRHNENRKMFPI